LNQNYRKSSPLLKITEQTPSFSQLNFSRQGTWKLLNNLHSLATIAFNKYWQSSGDGRQFKFCNVSSSANRFWNTPSDFTLLHELFTLAKIWNRKLHWYQKFSKINCLYWIMIMFHRSPRSKGKVMERKNWKQSWKITLKYVFFI